MFFGCSTHNEHINVHSSCFTFSMSLIKKHWKLLVYLLMYIMKKNFVNLIVQHINFIIFSNENTNYYGN